MSPPRVTHHGKQVLLDSEHLADAVSAEAAEVIAICVERAGLDNITDPAEREKVAGFLA